MAFRTLARGESIYPNNLPSDNALNVDPGFQVYQILNDEGFTVDPQRQLIHPSFNLVEGEGIFTYDNNPDITTGIILSPAPLVESTVQRTLSGSIVVQYAQNLDDVIIQEIWTGGKELSILSEMARKFYEFWREIPAPGQFLTWHPLDISSVGYGVIITNVQIGRPKTVNYREYRDDLNSRVGSYLAETVTVSMKIVSEVTAPRGVITVEGL
jgi:hypothetical protein